MKHYSLRVFTSTLTYRFLRFLILSSSLTPADVKKRTEHVKSKKALSLWKIESPIWNYLGCKTNILLKTDTTRNQHTKLKFCMHEKGIAAQAFVKERNQENVYWYSMHNLGASELYPYTNWIFDDGYIPLCLHTTILYLVLPWHSFWSFHWDEASLALKGWTT